MSPLSPRKEGEIEGGEKVLEGAGDVLLFTFSVSEKEGGRVLPLTN